MNTEGRANSIEVVYFIISKLEKDSTRSSSKAGDRVFTSIFAILAILSWYWGWCFVPTMVRDNLFWRLRTMTKLKNIFGIFGKHRGRGTDGTGDEQNGVTESVPDEKEKALEISKKKNGKIDFITSSSLTAPLRHPPDAVNSFWIMPEDTPFLDSPRTGRIDDVQYSRTTPGLFW